MEILDVETLSQGMVVKSTGFGAQLPGSRLVSL